MDLMKYSVSPLSRKQPEGSDEFYSALQEIITQKSLTVIKNSKPTQTGGGYANVSPLQF